MQTVFITKLFFNDSTPIIIHSPIHGIPRIGETVFFDEFSDFGSAKVSEVNHRFSKNEEGRLVQEVKVFLTSEELP